MGSLFGLSDPQMARLQPFFPKCHGHSRVDDHRVLIGIICINRNGLRWCYAPREYGPPKKFYNRWRFWGRIGVFARMMHGLVAEAVDEKTIMSGVSRRTPCIRVRLRNHLKAHRTASSLRVKGGVAS